MLQWVLGIWLPTDTLAGKSATKYHSSQRTIADGTTELHRREGFETRRKY